MNQIETITVICPKHGEHDHPIISTIPGHEGVWCQICWTDSMGQSLPYRKSKVSLESDSTQAAPKVESDSTAEGFKTMEEMIPIPEEGWKKLPAE